MHPKQFSKIIVLVFCLIWMTTSPVRGAITCEPDGLQDSGSIYRICIPSPGPPQSRFHHQSAFSPF